MEFRWVNGVGAVELTLTKGTANAASEGSEPKPVSGWFHKVSYLQHESAAGNDADPSSEPHQLSIQEQRKRRHQADDGSRVHTRRR